MRILHTADWHLGRLFYGTYLTEDQAYVLQNQFLKIIKEEKIDVVVIAGDLFDRAVPPADAVALWDEIMSKLALEYHIPTLVIAGNHDSYQRIEVGHQVLAQNNIHILGQVSNALKPIPLTDSWGTVDFCLMPFAEPQMIQAALRAKVGDRSGERLSHQEAYKAFNQYLQEQIPHARRTVGIAHLFVSGGWTSESERPLSIGGTEEVLPTIFDHYNYVALGHLHGPQQVGKESVRYSGSLLKYSFDEAKQKKSFTIVDLAENGDVSIKVIPVEARKDVVRIKGDFNELLLAENLQGKHKNDYLLFQLTNEEPIIDGLARLRKVYPSVMAIELTGRMGHFFQEDTIDTITYQNLDERKLFEQFAQAAWQTELNSVEKEYMNGIWQEVIKEDQA